MASPGKPLWKQLTHPENQAAYIFQEKTNKMGAGGTAMGLTC